MPAPDLNSLLPHQGPALLLDRVLASDASETQCLATIGAAHPYLNGQVEALIAVELIAQTAAVHLALQSPATDPSSPPQAGRLASVISLTLAVPTLNVGDELRICAHAAGSGSLKTVEGRVERKAGDSYESVAVATLVVTLVD